MVRILLNEEEKRLMKKAGIDPNLRKIGYEEEVNRFIEEDLGRGW